MTRPRFLADHDLNEHIIAGVRRREPAIEFFRVREFGMDQSLDAEVLEFAQRWGLIVVSHDVNTMPATACSRLSSGKPFVGLFMVQQSSPIATVIDDLILVWSATDLEDWANRVSFLPLA
ncbi:MAG: DUF5615 family PIN-like protein [Planctomycetota bacterium]